MKVRLACVHSKLKTTYLLHLPKYVSLTIQANYKLPYLTLHNWWLSKDTTFPLRFPQIYFISNYPPAIHVDHLETEQSSKLFLTQTNISTQDYFIKAFTCFYNCQSQQHLSHRPSNLSDTHCPSKLVDLHLIRTIPHLVP